MECRSVMVGFSSGRTILLGYLPSFRLEILRWFCFSICLLLLHYLPRGGSVWISASGKTLSFSPLTAFVTSLFAITQCSGSSMKCFIKLCVIPLAIFVLDVCVTDGHKFVLNVLGVFFTFVIVVAVIVVMRLLCICPRCFFVGSLVSWSGVQLSGIAVLQLTFYLAEFWDSWWVARGTAVPLQLVCWAWPPRQAAGQLVCPGSGSPCGGSSCPQCSRGFAWTRGCTNSFQHKKKR